MGFVFFIATSGLLVVLLTIDWAKTQSVFKFETIAVEGNHFVSDAEVKQLAKLDSERSLFEIDLAAVEKRVAKHQLIKGVNVSRRLPGTMVIKILERQPLAVIHGVP
ncbi:MAG TPA: FtsQ-type POTRA domain-containing protein, partial [bacterium]